MDIERVEIREKIVEKEEEDLGLLLAKIWLHQIISEMKEEN